METLKGKVAVVTGASSGIGRAAAQLFAQHGARVVVTARRRALLDALVEVIEAAGGQAAALEGDARDEDHAAAVVALATARFGGLDIAFNNAGTLGAMGPTTELEVAGWRDTIETNLTSAFLAARHQLPAMVARGGGAMVFTSTFVGHTVGMPQMAAYAASKAGLLGLMRALASEFAAHGVRVNALLPGGTDTDMGRIVAHSPEALAQIQRYHALGRIASAEEIARSALYLVSDASSFTTGTALLADGGFSIYRG